LLATGAGSYNLKVPEPIETDWHLSPGQAISLQRQLASMVVTKGDVAHVELVAGVDLSVDRQTGTGRAAVVMLDYPALDIVEVSRCEGKLEFPYIPGLLSFRELPLMLEAFRKLKHKPGLVMVDGHGLAHPRRLGIATHLGLAIEVPAIGCAKSCLCGSFVQPSEAAGSTSPLMDGGEQIGTVLRTRRAVKPVFISPGNRISMKESTRWALLTCRGYRLPEPVRQAHQSAGKKPVEV